MKPETRQTLIGVLSLTVVQIVALMEGFNGQVMAAYLVALVAMVAPEALDKALPWFKK